MAAKVQIVAILVSSGLFGIVLELVRRRRLMERYALLWLLASSVLLALAIWRDLLEMIASAIGIVYAPSALFVIAFGFILLILLHFSLVISRLADQNKILAQRLGMLQQQIEESDLSDEADAGGVGAEAAERGRRTAVSSSR